MYMSDVEAAAKTNFSDLPLDKAIECAKRFTYHSAPSFGNTLQYSSPPFPQPLNTSSSILTTSRYAGYKDPDNVAYILCTEDKTLVPAFQQTQIDNIDAARREAGRSETKVLKLGTSHCPHASAPVDVARAVVEAVSSWI